MESSTCVTSNERQPGSRRVSRMCSGRCVATRAASSWDAQISFPESRMVPGLFSCSIIPLLSSLPGADRGAGMTSGSAAGLLAGPRAGLGYQAGGPENKPFPAPPDKPASYEIGEDEAGMRLDRWLHRRFPDVSNSHLMRIVRKGEVRVSGKRADISNRLATGDNVRVPPLRIAAPQGPVVNRANPGDREAIRAMILFEDRDVLVLNKPYGLAVQGGSGTKRHVDGILQALADKEGHPPALFLRLP